jgi:hypothetical protein
MVVVQLMKLMEQECVEIIDQDNGLWRLCDQVGNFV